jgi:hypothetical protein
VASHGCTFDVQLSHDRRNLSLPHVTSGASREDAAPHGAYRRLRADDGPLGSNPLGRRFLHGATSRILLSRAILFDAATSRLDTGFDQ